MEHFEGRAIAQAFSGAMVELADVRAELFGGHLRQVGAFGQVLAQQAVGVLVGATLPGI